MKTLKVILYISFLLHGIIFFITSKIHSQECATGELTLSTPFENNIFGGYLKPHRTDLSNGNNLDTVSTLHMLFVFVEFTDEPDSSNAEWPENSPPVYMNRFLANSKNLTGDFWDRYPDSSLSDYYQELSLGRFHVTGEARHLRTSHSWSYYASAVVGLSPQRYS